MPHARSVLRVPPPLRLKQERKRSCRKLHGPFLPGMGPELDFGEWRPSATHESHALRIRGTLHPPLLGVTRAGIRSRRSAIPPWRLAYYPLHDEAMWDGVIQLGPVVLPPVFFTIAGAALPGSDHPWADAARPRDGAESGQSRRHHRIRPRPVLERERPAAAGSANRDGTAALVRRGRRIARVGDAQLSHPRRPVPCGRLTAQAVARVASCHFVAGPQTAAVRHGGARLGTVCRSGCSPLIHAEELSYPGLRLARLDTAA